MREGKGNRTGDESGGFKILLEDMQGKRHFMWMRGSKTEAGTFRICVDSPDEAVAGMLFGKFRTVFEEALNQ